MEVRRGCVDPQGKGLQDHQSVYNHLAVKHRRQEFLQYLVTTEFLLKNSYIDTSVQKGGIPGVPGCLKHTGVVTQLRKARDGKGDLTILWLDLANAYSSKPHKLVELTLRRHHVPSKVTDLVLDYYNNFRLRVTAGSGTSDWTDLRKA